MSLVLAVASRAHELFEKYGSIRAELGKACGEKFYPTLLVTARPVLGRRELLLRPGRRQRVTSKLGELGSVDDELGVGDPHWKCLPDARERDRVEVLLIGDMPFRPY